MQNGALQDYPLDEDDLENFYIRKCIKICSGERKRERERERKREREKERET